MGEDGKGIFDKMTANSLPGKTYKANIDLAFQKTTIKTQVSNVMGLLEGTDKKDGMFLSRHITIMWVKETLLFITALMMMVAAL